MVDLYVVMLVEERKRYFLDCDDDVSSFPADWTIELQNCTYYKTFEEAFAISTNASNIEFATQVISLREAIELVNEDILKGRE